MSETAAIKEDEIRPDDLFNEFMRLSAEDAESFFDSEKLIEIDCPACGNSEKIESFVKHGFSYNNCAACGSLYASPRPIASELLRYYATSKSQTFWAENILKHTGEKRKQSIMLPNVSRVEDIIERTKHSPKRVLDVGSANGTFLMEWKKRHSEAELFGIEPGEEAARQCRELGITVYENFVEDEAEKGDAQGDLVTCFEVLEHVQNPNKFAEAMYKVTAPGGVAIMSCLGVDGFDIQLLWEKSRSVMPPYHLNFLSRDGMSQLFKNSGFEKVEIITPGRLDVQIVLNSMERNIMPELSRFEKLLLSRGDDTLKAFQKFLAEHNLSSHVWIICHKST